MIHTKYRSRKAAAAVEFAALLPFIMFLAVISVDWARLLYFTITLDNCARNGALYACDAEAQYKSPYTNVTAAALAEAPALSQTPTVTQTNLADGGDGYPAVVVTVSMPFSTFTNFTYGKKFSVTKDNTLSRSVQMRVAPEAPK